MRASSSAGTEARRPSPALATAVSLLSGVLFLLSYPPFGIAGLGWCALVPLLLLRHRLDPGSLLFHAYLMAAVPVTGIAYNIAVFHVGAFAVVAISIPAAFALGFVVADGMERRLATPWSRLLAFPCWAITIEWVLRVAFHAPVPIGLSQTAHPVVVQSVDLLGPALPTFLLMLGNVCLERLLREAWRGGGVRRPEVAAALAGLMVQLANLTYGLAALRSWSETSPTLRIAAVQPAIGSETYRERWFNPEAQRAIDARVRALLDEAVARRPDLVFLSEGSDGRFGFRVSALRDRIQELARRTARGLVMASPDMTPAGDELNAVFSVAPDGRVLGRSAKQILTPVGEEHVARSGGRHVLPTAAGPIGTLICFESCFPEVARELVRNGAQLLFVSTSDAPFRNGSMPLLHSAFSILRAIETRRYVVQAANTGPSLIVEPTGRITGATPFLGTGLLTGAVEPLTARTPYSALGDVLPMTAVAWLLVAGWWRMRALADGAATVCTARRRLAPSHVVAGVAAAASVATVGAAASITISTARSGERLEIAAGLRRFVVTPHLDTSVHVARFRQTRPNTCGAAALAFALRFYDVDATEDAVARLIRLEDRGTNLRELARATAHFGMQAVGVRMSMAALERRTQPTIAHVGGDHFVVLIEIVDDRVLLFDPARGLVRMSAATFERAWDGQAMILTFPPSPQLDGAATAATSAPARDRG